MFSRHSSFALPGIPWAIQGVIIIVVYEENHELFNDFGCRENSVGPQQQEWIQFCNEISSVHVYLLRVHSLA